MKLPLVLKLFLLLMILSSVTSAQNTLQVKVADAASNRVLPGANVVLNGTTNGGATDKNGVAEIRNIQDGVQLFKASFLGYNDSTVAIPIPYTNGVFTIYLQPDEEMLDEVIVSSTRTNSRIEDLPLKVEVLGLEEMNEESALVPGNIASILGDLAVITIQRTNPINGNDAIRMQGLDPQYTLIARDGLPLYGGFSGSLGVLSIPPLDLKQIEIIKGSVSTLYGGGAIAGMLNIISKTPSNTPQRTLLFNVSTLKEKNVNSFFSGKISDKVGYTLFAGANLRSPVDVNKDGFTEIPEHQNYILHPRIFFTLTDKTKLNIGLTSNLDTRRTGDIVAVKHEETALHPYLRKENAFRNVLDVDFTHSLSTKNTLILKTAASVFQRKLSYPYRTYTDFSLNGVQYSSYTEVSDKAELGKHTLVIGLNLITESFNKKEGDPILLGNYSFITIGAFAQNDWAVTDKFTVEGGVRFDHHNINGNFLLPRIALFYKATEKLSLRLASGAGYKTPNILSLSDPTPYLSNNNTSTLKSERSVGINADINFKTTFFDAMEVSLNQAFYYATISNPLRLITDTISQSAVLENQHYHINTFGSDTYVQLSYKSFELYFGYNHTEALQHYSSTNISMPFNPKDKFSTTLAYEIEGKWRMGIEGSYTANQYAYSNGTFYSSQTIYPSRRVPNFWFLAAMVERKFAFGSLVLNVENLTDARQAKHESLVSGPATSPSFRPIWGPLDGRVFNLSLKINLLKDE
jgi:outer membrane receptor for ferrienterochelin and colicins